VYITTQEGLFTIAVNGRLYQIFEPGNAVSRYYETLGCRMPASESGATVLQQNGYLADKLGGVWIATCSYTIFATYCPDFEGSTIEAGIILRNGFRFPEPGVRSMAEPNNAPWNLRSCGGEMYLHLFNANPAIHEYARWQGPGEPGWATAVESDCGSGTAGTTLSAPTHV